MYAAHNVATYVISEYWKLGKTITNLKLQKILYYIQGYSYKFCNMPSFDEKIYKWPYGPVVPDVYFRYNYRHAMPLEDPPENERSTAFAELKSDSKLFSVIKRVIKKSHEFEASELVDKSHQESPWKNTVDNAIISEQKIAEYFFDHDPLGLGGQS